MSTKGPVKGTRISSGRYFLIRADGRRRIWTALTRVAEGLPAFYTALSAALQQAARVRQRTGSKTKATR